MSENLAKIAQKIDFNKTNGEEIKKEQIEGEKGDEDTKDSTSFQSSLWPWDSVRNKLRFVIFFLYFEFFSFMQVIRIPFDNYDNDYEIHNDLLNLRIEFHFFYRNALTEVCVLADVLAIAKEKNYMVLDPVPQEPVEVKPMIQVYARKKALAGAASVLMLGAERLRNCQTELARTKSTPDFHIELLRLRQNWRLKKVSNSIIGDLSYRTG